MGMPNGQIDYAQVLDSRAYVEECERKVREKRRELAQAQDALKMAQRRHEEIRRGR